jgi:hypothetical protein
MSTIRLTLNQSLEEVIQELEQAYKPMSRTEILKMTIAEFYSSRFNKTTKTTTTSKSSTKKIKTIDNWVDTGVEPDIEKGEIEEAFGEWWSLNKNDLRN